MRYSTLDQAMRTAAKPRIRYLRKYGIFQCQGQSIETTGISPAQAYSAWETCNEARKGITQSRKSFRQILDGQTPEEKAEALRAAYRQAYPNRGPIGGGIAVLVLGRINQ